MITVSQLFKSIATEEELPMFLNIYMEYHPILEDYEKEAISEEDYEKVVLKFKELASKRIKEFAMIEPKKVDEVIFIVEQKESSFYSKETYMHSFLCNISDIKEKAYLDFALWNEDKPRIEHYCYDFSPLDEIMGCEVVFNGCRTEAICEIFHELIFNGLTEESSQARKEEIINSLKEAEKDIKEGRTYTMEEVFEKLEAQILEGATEEEKEKILKAREEKERNRFRDDVYNRAIMYQNHNACIDIIRSWYLENIQNGNIQITEKLV